MHQFLKIFFLFSVLIFSTGYIGSAQGLTAEIGLNDDYNQSVRGLVTVDEFTYLAKFQNTSSFYSTSNLYKIDSTGNVLWNSLIMPILAEFILVYDMIPSETGGVYITGYGMPICDVGQDCIWFIQKFNPQGAVEFTTTWTDPFCFSQSELTGLSLSSNNELLVNLKSTGATSVLYKISSGGIVMDSIVTPTQNYGGLCDISGLGIVGYHGDSIHVIDNNGNITYTRTFGTNISDIRSFNDSLYVLSHDSLFIFDNSMNILQSNSVQGYSLYTTLKLLNGNIQFISNNSGTPVILEINKQLQPQNIVNVPESYNGSMFIDFNSFHFADAYDFPITLHKVIRYRDFSLTANQNIQVNNTDIGIADIDITQINLQPQNPSGVYQYTIAAAVKLRNYGTKVLNSCRINHQVVPIWICNEIFYTNEFSNLNLAPNDSMWINLGVIHNGINQFSDTVDVDICVYTSHPNGVTDTIVPNDEFCKNVFMGIVGMEEHTLQNIVVYPNPVTDVFYIKNPGLLNLTIKVNDLLGNVIYKATTGLDLFNVDMHQQPSGVYLMQLTSKGHTVTKKIIKQ